jgi:hypothetical protein
MQLDSYPKLLLFVFLIFLTGFFAVQYLLAKKDSRKYSKLFAWILVGMFLGVAGDITLLQFPLYKYYPQITSLVNTWVLVVFFIFLPAIGGFLSFLIYSIFFLKNREQA